MRNLPKILLVVLLGTVAAVLIYDRLRLSSPPIPETPSMIPIYTYRLINTYPHDPNAFTQGLAFEEGVLYEGTGRVKQSTLRRVELETGQVLKLHRLPDHVFGEGITLCGDRIIQLTYTSHTGFIYNKDTFEVLREFTYPTEGWGIACDGERLIMSDGTSWLRFFDPETFEAIDSVEVRAGGIPVTGLNELEYVRGEILANVRPTSRIAKISLPTGEVSGWIDLAWLEASLPENEDIGVLNGIAHDVANDRLFVTGKLWPKVFEIELVPLQ